MDDGRASWRKGVLELLRAGKPFTKENLERAYVARRRASWVEAEGAVAERARDGFQRGVVPGLVGMALAGLTGGRLALGGIRRDRRTSGSRPWRSTTRADSAGRGSRRIREDCAKRAVSLHDALMERAGWPAIPYDGQLLVSHQDALLLGGKVQAPAGYADHVVFLYPNLCETCGEQGLHRDVFGAGDHARATAACRPSTARSAFTAARVSGTVPRPIRRIRSGRPSSFAPEPAVCIRQRTDVPM